jgi:hypothetical protein
MELVKKKETPSVLTTLTQSDSSSKHLRTKNEQFLLEAISIAETSNENCLEIPAVISEMRDIWSSKA